MRDDKYNVVIKSKFKKGFLNYGEVIIPGKTRKEILITTNICHPSMGNNETSGIVVTTALAQWISKIKNRRYTYRILFIPETIGSIAYIHSNKSKLKKNVIAGFGAQLRQQLTYLSSKEVLFMDRALYALNKYIKI